MKQSTIDSLLPSTLVVGCSALLLVSKTVSKTQIGMIQAYLNTAIVGIAFLLNVGWTLPAAEHAFVVYYELLNIAFCVVESVLLKLVYRRLDLCKNICLLVSQFRQLAGRSAGSLGEMIQIAFSVALVKGFDAVESRRERLQKEEYLRAQGAGLMELSQEASKQRKRVCFPAYALYILIGCGLLLYALQLDVKAEPIPYYFIAQPLKVFSDSVQPVLLLVLASQEYERLKARHFADYLVIALNCLFKQLINPICIGLILGRRSLADVAPTGISAQLFYDADVLSWLLAWPAAALYEQVPPK